MTGTHHQTKPLVEMGVSQTFCPGWPQTKIHPISASQIARITGVNHYTQLVCLHLKMLISWPLKKAKKHMIELLYKVKTQFL
jgi:hypothetical protein